MLSRKIPLVLIVLIAGVIVVLAAESRFTTRAAAQATPAATDANNAADCEALRTVAKPLSTSTPVTVARPSSPGGPGKALQLIGDPTAGEKIYIDTCQRCHGEQGKGGVSNPGSDDGTMPALNPIDDSLVDVDPLVYACNIDLYIEHGSLPSGPSPDQIMPNWGDGGNLSSQDIADVIAYIIKLNNGPLVTTISTAEP